MAQQALEGIEDIKRWVDENMPDVISKEDMKKWIDEHIPKFLFTYMRAVSGYLLKSDKETLLGFRKVCEIDLKADPSNYFTQLALFVIDCRLKQDFQ